MLVCPVHEQIDLRKESTIQFVAPSSYPVITFGPFASPTAVLISYSHAIGNFLRNCIVIHITSGPGMSQ